MKQIPLTQGLYAVVDDDDFEELNRHKWTARRNRPGGVTYAARGRKASDPPGAQQVRMHRAVMGDPQRGLEIDHINGNGLDNRKSNLRFTDAALNRANSRKFRNSKNRYKGVRKTTSGRWQALVTINHKQIHIGTYDDPLDAARAFDAWVALNRGGQGSTNQSLGLLS